MIRVLFVDDEPRVLDGIRRSLRSRRKAWHLVFAEGGEAGCEALESGEFDVVITDLRMPGVDGCAVLEKAKEVHPDTMRIIFSGQVHEQEALRAVPLAHQYLAKPCGGGAIERVIERAALLRQLFANQSLRGVISAAGAIPSCPKVYLELTEVLRDPESSARDAADVLERDMAMCTKILQIVNSAFFGLSQPVTNLQDAVSFLGLKLVRSIALSEAAFRPFEGKGVFGPTDLSEHQKSGFRAAALARDLCPDKAQEDHAYLAGMLHDFGWVVIGCLLPEAFAELEERSGKSGLTLSLEREVLGATHAEIGAYLLGTWGLPLPVVEAVAYHHHPARVEHDSFEVLTAIHVASGLMAETDQSRPRRGARLDERYLSRVGALGALEAWRQRRDDVLSAP